jgi:hypothetical protein
MVLNATFNNIPVISWRSVLLLEEIRVKYNSKITEQSYKGKVKRTPNNLTKGKSKLIII